MAKSQEVIEAEFRGKVLEKLDNIEQFINVAKEDIQDIRRMIGQLGVFIHDEPVVDYGYNQQTTN